MIEFDFCKTYTSNELDDLFMRCPWCNELCNERNVFEDPIAYVTWLKCEDCRFSVRYDHYYQNVDFFFYINDARCIQIIADREEVLLMEWNKVLKILSSSPLSNLTELKELVDKYSVLI